MNSTIATLDDPRLEGSWSGLRLSADEFLKIDDKLTFYRLDDGRFVEVRPSGDSFASQAVPGFVLDLRRVRDLFRRG